jgi:hypothetical protein
LSVKHQNQMYKLLLTYAFSFLLFLASAQKKKAIELSMFGRYDQHADYVTNYSGRTQVDTMQLYGKSYGVSLNYRYDWGRGFFMVFGVGYYRLGVDKINTTQHPFQGISHYRPINYIDRSSIYQSSWLYSTPAYHYNNISLSISAEKSFSLDKKLSLDISGGFSKFYTFSQGYKVPPVDEMFPNWTKKWLGSSVNVGIGLCKSIKDIYINPEIILPVYQHINGDKVLGENPEIQIEKWFRGGGLAIKVCKYLK